MRVWLVKTYRKIIFYILLRRRYKERLKDVIIDHIYVMGFEKIHRNERSGPEGYKSSFGPRESKFIEIYSSDKRDDFTRSLHIRLFHRGIQVSPKSLNNRLIELLNKGYIVEGVPMHWSFGLTAKGLVHYSEGRSFEDSFRKNRLSKIALWISIPAAIIAIISLLKAFCLFPFNQ